MTDSNDNQRGATGWLRANFRTLLLVANTILIVVLFYYGISQAVFEMQVNRMMDTADEIAAQAAKAEETKKATHRPSSRPRPKPPSPKPKPTTETVKSETPTTSTVATTTGTAKAETPSTSTVAKSETPSSSTVATSTTGTRTVAATGGGPTSGAVASMIGGADRSVKASHAESAFGRPAGPSKPPKGKSGPPGRTSGKTASPEDAKKKEKFAMLTKRGLFGAKPVVAKKVCRLEAILGDSALVDGKWVEVGAEVQTGKVVEITTDKIVVEDEEGKRHDMYLVGGAPKGGPPPGARSSGRETPFGGPGRPPTSPGGPSMTIRSGEIRGGPGSMQISDSILERLTGPGGRFEGMSREQIMEQMREMRGRGGSRGGRSRRGGGRSEPVRIR